MPTIFYEFVKTILIIYSSTDRSQNNIFNFCTPTMHVVLNTLLESATYSNIVIFAAVQDSVLEILKDEHIAKITTH
jgi:hypothetical protein